jgi:RNA polymerase sigma-70 factor (ECF subfamily)
MPAETITPLLKAWSLGDEDAANKLVPMVEPELRRIASRYLKRENGNCSLLTSDLINEAYIKLLGQRQPKWINRNHFFAISSLLVRRILLNHARGRMADKRAGALAALNIDHVDAISPEKAKELIALDDSLARLAEFDPIKARIVEMRYFGGLTANETADVLGITPSSVTRQWNLARAWLGRQMKK